MCPVILVFQVISPDFSCISYVRILVSINFHAIASRPILRDALCEEAAPFKNNSLAYKALLWQTTEALWILKASWSQIPQETDI